MADVPQAPKPGNGSGPKRRPRRRLGIRVDMTPMVDVAFLLLIFFMVTTVFRQPLAMEVNMPEPGAEVRVPESNVLTVTVDASGSLTTRQGTAEPQPAAWSDLDSLFRSGLEANPDLIVLVKIDRHARYNDMVEMMDALEGANMQRFSLVPLEAPSGEAPEEPR